MCQGRLWEAQTCAGGAIAAYTETAPDGRSGTASEWERTNAGFAQRAHLMGCNSDYLQPSGRETDSRRACALLVYLGPQIKEIVPDWAEIGAIDIYGDTGHLQDAVALLCSWCGKAPDAVIYNGRSREARRLADWWEYHQAADETRRKNEAEKLQKNKLRAEALAKLTEAEIEAIGLEPG